MGKEKETSAKNDQKEAALMNFVSNLIKH